MNMLPELERARAFIDEHLDQPLSLDDMAERAHLSRYHFMKPPTKEFYGIEALFRDGCGNWFSLTEHSDTY